MAKENASEEKRPKESTENQSKSSQWYTWLSHPLLLLLVGAIISSLLIPYITRHWQDHQKELELKTALVNQITDATINPLAEAEFIFTRGETQNQQQRSDLVNRVYRDWEIKGAEIGEKLAAYFPRTSLSKDWFKYYDAMRQYYLLESDPTHVDIDVFWRAIRLYFAQHHITIGTNGRTMDEEDFQRLQFLFRQRMDEFIHAILDSSIATY